MLVFFRAAIRYRCLPAHAEATKRSTPRPGAEGGLGATRRAGPLALWSLDVRESVAASELVLAAGPFAEHADSAAPALRLRAPVDSAPLLPAALPVASATLQVLGNRSGPARHRAELAPGSRTLQGRAGLSQAPVAPDPAPTLVGAQTEAAYQHASAMTNSPALTLTVEARSGRARTCKLQLPHFVAETPMFMPVGTQGSIKGLTTEQVEELDCHVILGNTYHLGLRPGAEVMDQLGGLHRFMNWNRGLLTDSGGFQMVSLLKLADITEEGVNFQSPVDGTHLLLTPEKSMEIQNSIEADIMMALDDVVPATANNPTRTEEATHRTLRWMRRCIAAHKKPHVQNLFGIIQGGFDRDLRSYCIKEMVNLNLPGYAIGGISGGEEKSLTWQVVDQCTALLPENKPKYCMGIGYPVDLVCFVALGTDMFDCVYPSRTARYATAYH
eukprot:tig00020554_g10798.t1